jgi:hypothetical protein
MHNGSKLHLSAIFVLWINLRPCQYPDNTARMLGSLMNYEWTKTWKRSWPIRGTISKEYGEPQKCHSAQPVSGPILKKITSL